MFLNSVVVFLFMLPIVTMRSYAEEKRSGTIELLLTAPLTDLQIILGKFAGAMGLYASMLVITMLSVGTLFFFGTPELKPLLTTYLGLLLMGGCFVSVGLLISSLHQQSDHRRRGHLRRLPDPVGDQLAAPFAPRPWLQTFLNYASIVDHFDDFSRGVLDTKHVVYYVSFIAVGPVPDRAVGGHRTVAGVVMQRALNWLAWVGVGDRVHRRAGADPRAGWKSMPVSARLDQYAMYASWAGLALVVVYALQSAWAGGAQLALRHARPGVSVGARPGDPGGGQLRGVAPEQALGLHRQPAVHAVGPDDEAAAGAHGAGEDPRLRPGRAASSASAPA